MENYVPGRTWKAPREGVDLERAASTLSLSVCYFALL